jgi:hypothetical protein
MRWVVADRGYPLVRLATRFLGTSVECAAGTACALPLPRLRMDESGTGACSLNRR